MHATLPRLFPTILATALTVATSAAPLAAQHVLPPGVPPAHAHGHILSRGHVIIPQRRAFAIDCAPAIRIESVRARVKILEQSATTELEVVVRNTTGRPQEAVVLLPVPDGIALTGFVFGDGRGGAPEPTARLLPREEARRTYDSIVATLRDPALLEFAGYRLVRSSVFPVAAGGAQGIRVTYDHLLPRDGGRIDYVLPRSESLEQVAPWDVTVDIVMKSPIAMVYSPSHDLVTEKRGPRHVTVRIAGNARNEPGAFLLSCLLGGQGASASLLACPDPRIGGGYFLLMASLPALSDDATPRRREVTLVLDRSGSMAGAKLDQARAAALQVIEALDDGDGFQIVDYASDVARFADRAVVKDGASTLAARTYLAALRPGGGTNIHDALLEALHRPVLDGMLPIVLFLTDGLPTVGRTSETAIRELVAAGNAHGRRVFTFGVGADVNVPLLDRIAELTRAASAYVLPQESVELELARTFRKLHGPVLAEPRLETVAADGTLDTRRVREPMPAELPDLFDGDQVIVLGQYRGDAPLHFRLSGRQGGREQAFQFRFPLAGATTRNAFVPRLWASRRIAHLADQVRQAGAAGTGPRLAGTDPFLDPKLRELRDEILRLSAEFGVLSEYTAFLATEGTRLSDWGALTATCQGELGGKAMDTRSGLGAVNQAWNMRSQKGQSTLNRRNVYLDQKLERVETSNVQQVCDRAFFREGERWVDSRIVLSGDLSTHETVTFGSPAHRELLERLERAGQQATLSVGDQILLRVDGKNVLVTNERN